MKPNSVMGYRRRKGQPPAFLLQKGQFRFDLARWNTQEPNERPRFSVRRETCEVPPESHLLGKAAVFNVSVYPAGPSDWVPLEGKIELSVVQKSPLRK